MTREEYAVLVKDVESMLGMLSFSMIEEEAEEGDSVAPGGGRGKSIVLVAVAAVIVIALIALSQ